MPEMNILFFLILGSQMFSVKAEGKEWKKVV